MALLTKNTNK